MLPTLILGLSLALVGWLVFSVVLVELADTVTDDSSAYSSDEQQCSSESVQMLFGQQVGKEVLLVAKLLSGVSSVRVLSMPGRDLSYVPDRLNLEVNEQSRIVAAFCG
ncbi:I78 family peptidase inhibitor [Pseudomonas tructae]|nr:I78 family peptidase inhibitor [Pseudomonas tructae]